MLTCTLGLRTSTNAGFPDVLISLCYDFGKIETLYSSVNKDGRKNIICETLKNTGGYNNLK